jgi:hypothetical protein
MVLVVHGAMLGRKGRLGLTMTVLTLVASGCADGPSVAPTRDTQTAAASADLDPDDDVQVMLDQAVVTLLAEDERRSGRLGVVIRNVGTRPFAVTSLHWVNVEALEIELHAIVDENRVSGSTQATDLDIDEPADVVHPARLPYTVAPTGGGPPPEGQWRGTPWMGTEFVFRYDAPPGGHRYAAADLLRVSVALPGGSERTVVADTALLICDDDVYTAQDECEFDAFGEHWGFARE